MYMFGCSAYDTPVCKVILPLFENCVISYSLLKQFFLLIYVYICIEEKTTFHKKKLFCISEYKWPLYENSSFLLLYIKIYIWKWHKLIIHPIYCIEASDVSKKTSFVLYYYVYINNIVVKIFLHCVW